MEKCDICNREYPKGLVQLAEIKKEAVAMCPLCYAERFESMHGILWEPVGEIADELFKQAKNLYPDWEPGRKLGSKKDCCIQFETYSRHSTG